MPIVAHPTGDPAKPQDKLSKYFIPICENIDKITARQLFKIQRQMKSFVEKVSRSSASNQSSLIGFADPTNETN